MVMQNARLPGAQALNGIRTPSSRSARNVPVIGAASGGEDLRTSRRDHSTSAAPVESRPRGCRAADRASLIRRPSP